MELGIWNYNVLDLEGKVQYIINRYGVSRSEAIETVADILGFTPENVQSVLYEAQIAGIIE